MSKGRQGIHLGVGVGVGVEVAKQPREGNLGRERGLRGRVVVVEAPGSTCTKTNTKYTT